MSYSSVEGSDSIVSLTSSVRPQSEQRWKVNHPASVLPTPIHASASQHELYFTGALLEREAQLLEGASDLSTRPLQHL